MNQEKIISGVGVLVGRLGNTVETIEKWFPIDYKRIPKRFEKPFYPRYTDTLFMKAIYDLAGKQLTCDDLSRTASYNRVITSQKEAILSMSTRDAFNTLEPQFCNHPEVVEDFIAAASRYANPFPIFELDLKYGAADLLFGNKICEMKSYSVANIQDIISSRNQVLAYACLIPHTPKFANILINEIEVVNALTNEVWTWDFSEFRKSGEADRLYWSLLIPLLANDSISDEEISMLKHLYDQKSTGVDLVARVMHEKTSKLNMLLLRKIYQLRARLEAEVNARKYIANKNKGITNGKSKQYYNWFFDNDSEIIDFDMYNID